MRPAMKDNMPANLLFLYGPSGSGKTRMLQAIESVCEGQGSLRVGSERLVDEMTRSIGNREFTGFFDRYLHTANLLIDNLWVLRSRPSAAQEIGLLIKARVAQGKLTILASDLRYDEAICTLPAIGDCLKQERTTRLRLGNRDVAAGRLEGFSA